MLSSLYGLGALGGSQPLSLAASLVPQPLQASSESLCLPQGAMPVAFASFDNASYKHTTAGSVDSVMEHSYQVTLRLQPMT